MNSFFSVIIPTYNRELTIEKSLGSLMNQTFVDFEVIVVDNNSTDKTVSIVESIKDPRVKLLINKKNYERCFSRNRGIANANGMYILFLDSDDFFEKYHLQNWFEYISKNDIKENFLICNKKTFKSNVLQRESISLPKDIYHFLITTPVLPGQVCIHRNLLENYQFNSRYLIFEDTALWLQLARITDPIFVHFNSFVYVIHDCNSVDWKINNFGVTRLESIKNFFNDNELFIKLISRKKYNYLLSNTYFTIAKFFIHKNNDLKSIYFVFKSLFSYPSTYQLKHRFLIFIKLIVFIPINEYKN